MACCIKLPLIFSLLLQLPAYALVGDKPTTAADDKIPAPDKITLIAGDYHLVVERGPAWTLRGLTYQGKDVLVPLGWMQPVLNVKTDDGKDDFIGTGHGGEEVLSLELSCKGLPVRLKTEQSEYRAKDGASLVLTKRSTIGPYAHRSVLELSPSGLTQGYEFEVTGDTTAVNYLYSFMLIFPKVMNAYREELQGGEFITGDLPEAPPKVSYLPGHEKVVSLSLLSSDGFATSCVFGEPLAARNRKGLLFAVRTQDNKYYCQVNPPLKLGENSAYHLKMRCAAATRETFIDVAKNLVKDLSKHFEQKTSSATTGAGTEGSHNAEAHSATDTVTFDASQLGEPRRGNIGFLHGIFPDALPPEWVTEIKPTLWRGPLSTQVPAKAAPSITGLDGFIYLRDTLHVPRQLMIVQAMMRNEPYKTIVQKDGLQAAVAALARDAKAGGYGFEWDVINEPNIGETTRNKSPQFKDVEQFVDEVWNPTVRGLRSVDPSAKIHGPSLTFVNAYNQGCHEKLFDLLTRAHAANTLPNYVNWHCQDGYDIAKAHGAIAEEIRTFYRDHQAKLDGLCCGETIRPGNERNTSPAVAIDVFAAAEIHNVDQIHACWGSVKIYDQDLNRIPTLCGLLNKNWSGRRGVWWTYRFYAQSEGQRISCLEGPSGSERLVALGFADKQHSKLRLMVGLRDGIKSPLTASIKVSHLFEIPSLINDETVQVSIWENPQTEEAITLSEPTQIKRITVTDGSVSLTANLAPWGAALIEISP